MRVILAFLLLLLPLLSPDARATSAGGRKTIKGRKSPSVLTPTSFAGVPVGASRAAAAGKGFTCKDVKIGDYLVIHECRKAIVFDSTTMQAYVLMNSAGNRAEAVGCDQYFDGGAITPAQDRFYKLVTAVQTILEQKPAVTTTPDTYLALTNFEYPHTVVSCYLYSDDRTKPPRLRCGVEVRNRK